MHRKIAGCCVAVAPDPGWLRPRGLSESWPLPLRLQSGFAHALLAPSLAPFGESVPCPLAQAHSKMPATPDPAQGAALRIPPGCPAESNTPPASCCWPDHSPVLSSLVGWGLPPGQGFPNPAAPKKFSNPGDSSHSLCRFLQGLWGRRSRA